MSKQAQELKDLDVDRVDAVDRPATGRNFLLFKSKDGVKKTVDGTAVMKGYALVSTAADAVLKAVRKDSKATVSRKSAVAINGLAQVMGQDAVFVGKNVPTQPYEIDEAVDGDKRGPADEDLDENFTPRSMPGSQVGSDVIKMKKEADEMMADEDEDEMKGKAKGKAKAADKDEDDEKKLPDFMKSMAEGMAKMADAIAKSPESIAKAIMAAAKAEAVSKGEGDDEPEPVRKAAPRSKQVDADDEPADRVRVRKGDYEPRMGVSFADVAFGGKR